MSTYLRRSAKRFLTHTCDFTRVQTTLVVDGNGDPILDEWGQKQYADEEIVEDIPCLLLWKDVQAQTANGPIIKKDPFLYVLNTTILSRGNIINSVRTRKSTVLLNNATVDTIRPVAEFGEGVINLVTLNSMET